MNGNAPRGSAPRGIVCGIALTVALVAIALVFVHVLAATVTP